MPNCTAYAYGRAYEILGSEPKLSWNNAEQWYDYNKSNGYYKYGKDPKVGAIACWSYSYGGGHVAVVEKVENGVITLSNSAYSGDNFTFPQRVSPTRRLAVTKGGIFRATFTLAISAAVQALLRLQPKGNLHNRYI